MISLTVFLITAISVMASKYEVTGGCLTVYVNDGTRNNPRQQSFRAATVEDYHKGVDSLHLFHRDVEFRTSLSVEKGHEPGMRATPITAQSCLE